MQFLAILLEVSSDLSLNLVGRTLLYLIFSKFLLVLCLIHPSKMYYLDQQNCI